MKEKEKKLGNFLALPSLINPFKLCLLSFFSIFALAAASHAAVEVFGIRLPDFLDPLFGTPVSLGLLVPPDTSWFNLSMLALLINYLIAALGYILAGMLGPKVSAWSKQLIYANTKSLIIVLFIFAGFSITTCSSHGGSSSQGIVCVGFLQIERAISFVETVRNTIMLEFGTLTATTASLSLVLNITPYLRPAGIIGISFSLSPAFRPLFDILGILLSLLSAATGEWFVQTWLLVFIKSRMLSILLPLGIFLRAFGMRGGGDALIAIAVGFFFVYPFMLNASAYAIERYLQAEYGPGDVVQSSDGQAYSSFWQCTDASTRKGSSILCYFKLATKGALENVKSLLKYIELEGGLLIFALMMLFAGALPTAAAISFAILYFLALLKVSIFYVVIVSIVIPVFIFMVVLAFIKELSAFLGTPIDLSAFEKLI